MSKVRAVRLPPAEDKQIQEFLRRNPFFDFSTMTRLALMQFIENPELTLKPVKKEKPASKRRESHVSV